MNQHWYNRNETQVYPIDERSTAIDDTGVRLGHSILIDLSLGYAGLSDDEVFVSSVSVTTMSVALVVLVRRQTDPTGVFRPLASFTAAKPIDENRALPLASLGESARGWVTLGSGIQQPYSGRFSSPQQSRVATRTTHTFRGNVLESVVLPYSTEPQSGLVDIRPTAPVVVAAESISIPGIGLRRVIVFSLDDSQTYESTYRAVTGACQQRAEEGNCGSPEPIRTVNSVVPDCNGQLVVEFIDCATPFPVSPLSRNTVEIRCGLTQAVLCKPTKLPDADGVLPGEPPVLTSDVVIPDEPSEPGV